MSSNSSSQHHEKAQGKTARCAVLTISDTRTTDSDLGGKLIIDLLKQAGHTVSDYTIARDEPDKIDHQLKSWLGLLDQPPATSHQPPNVIISTGGTGIAQRDTTIEVAQRLITKELPGFGELFRMLSYDQVGAAAMLSRAVAGLAGETLIFTLPGSPNAVRLAVEKLIIPELSHMVWERGR